MLHVTLPTGIPRIYACSNSLYLLTKNPKDEPAFPDLKYTNFNPLGFKPDILIKSKDMHVILISNKGWHVLLSKSSQIFQKTHSIINTLV